MPRILNGGEQGWLHPVGEAQPPRPIRVEREAPSLNVEQRLKEWRGTNRPAMRPVSLCIRLGVTLGSLDLLECTKAPYRDTWAFPMRSGDNHYTGIRLRNEAGEKWAERGSHAGLFIPQCEPFGIPLIVEGPTDAAAALSMGYYAIGRPSCCGGAEHLVTAMRRMKAARAVIVADLDDPGLRGAKTLAEHIGVPAAILVCPAKDMRAFANAGGNKEMLDAMIAQLVWRQPNA